MLKPHFRRKLLQAAAFGLIPSLRVGQALAQTDFSPPGKDPTLMEGAWVAHVQQGTKGFYDYFEAGDPYPLIDDVHASNLIKPTPELRTKLLALRKLFIDAYPKPLGYSFLYSLKSTTKATPSNPQGINFHAGAFGLFNGKKINIYGGTDGPARGSLADRAHLSNLNVSINSGLAETSLEMFTLNKPLTDAIDKEQIPNLTNVYIRPPADNFEEAIADYNQRNPSFQRDVPELNDGSGADKFMRFRRMSFLQNWQIISEKVIVSRDGKLPFVPLTRGVFLQLLDLLVAKDAAKAQANFEQIQGRSPQDARAIERAKRALVDNDFKQKIVDRLREIHTNDLKKPATVLPQYQPVLSGNFHPWFQFNGPQTIFNENKVVALFSDEIELGYTPCKRLTYFRSNRMDDWHYIAVKWQSFTATANNKKYADEKDESRYFYEAMRTQFSWDGLERLVAP